MKNIETARGAEEPPSAEKALLEQETLAHAYACGIDAEPEWCVSETQGAGEEKVLHWIRPAIEAEFVAMRMARLATVLGAPAVAKKTKWNRDAE